MGLEFDTWSITLEAAQQARSTIPQNVGNLAVLKYWARLRLETRNRCACWKETTFLPARDGTKQKQDMTIIRI